MSTPLNQSTIKGIAEKIRELLVGKEFSVVTVTVHPGSLLHPSVEVYPRERLNNPEWVDGCKDLVRDDRGAIHFSTAGYSFIFLESRGKGDLPVEYPRFSFERDSVEVRDVGGTGLLLTYVFKLLPQDSAVAAP